MKSETPAESGGRTIDDRTAKTGPGRTIYSRLEDRMKQPAVFLLLLSVLIGGAIVRSHLATGLDSFTFDEAYHIGAGAAYVKTGDYRLNPEHPPLVKLWIGTFLSAQGFQTSSYRTFADKSDERAFVETDVYFNNDPDVVQTRSRAAMFALNGLLMLIFALAASRVFGEIVALSATAFLTIDPTTAAHLPVVMTDLPVALLSVTAVLAAVRAFRDWRTSDLVFASLTLGLALGVKHSAIVTLAAVGFLGIGAALLPGREVSVRARLQRIGLAAAVLAGAMIVLWSFYQFRYAESPLTAAEQFNRPLDMKISDVKSPFYRAGLNLMKNGRLMPRAYIWGLADTVRAGAEGRAIPVLAFGSLYFNRAPFYYFPAVIALKLPLGLLVLTMTGAVLLIFRQVPSDWRAPLGGLFIFAAAFLLVLISGSTYAGIRHALPLVPVVALLGALPIYAAVRHGSRFLSGIVILAIFAAALSAIPGYRPWEYYNELVGTENAYRYFDDEGIDLSLRTREVAEYYEKNLKPNGEIPYLIYFSPKLEWKSRGLDWVGNNPDRDAEMIFGERLSGTFIIGASNLSPKLFWDFGEAFRDARPVARMGNVFVFRGTFPASPAAQSFVLYMRAVHGKIYTAEPDLDGAIKLLERSAALDPRAFFVALELGNQYLKSGNRPQALGAYRMAAENAPRSDGIYDLLVRQIERLENEPLAGIQPLRNPGIE